MSPDSNSPDIVTAVIVAHDGAAWLPRVVEAVANQSRPVQRVIAVDTGSRDRSGAMLAQAFGRAAVFGMERTTGYGVAIAKALRHRAANTPMPPSGAMREERTEWVWLLHDDCEPAPDALERLLNGAREAPSAAVLGPKVRDWSDRDVLLEAGLTIDRAGRRVTGIEPREADQGQHDGDRDVLAVSSAGMLARRDVWDEVGGFDPGMRLFREDTDFCWRVQAAGYRVRVITDAIVYHVEASARNRRQPAAAPRPRRQDRGNALLVLAGNLPRRPMLSALAGNLVLSALRTIFFLLAKRPSAALDELAAYLSVPGHPMRLLRARRRRATGRQAAYSRLSGELPPGRSFRLLGEYVITTLSKSQRAEAVGSHHATDDPSDDDSLLVDSGLVQRLLTNPGVLLFLTLTVLALVAERSLLGGTPLGGGALVPAWGGASGLWQEYLQGFHPASIGTSANAPPYVAVIALLATVLGGKPWLAVDLILLGCVPLAGISAYLATRRVTRSVVARIVGALAYALLPVGIGAVAAGRLGTAVLLVLLPPVGVLAARVFTAPPRRARRAAWAMALLVALVAAFVPLFWLIALVAVAVGAVLLGRGRTDRVLNAGIVAVVPPLLLLPWILEVLSRPARLLLEAGVAQPGLATPGLPARSLLLLSPGGPGLPPFWVAAGVALAATAALVLAGGRGLVLAGWAVGVTGLITAALVSHIAVSGTGTAGPVQAWPGPALAVAGAGLLLAVVAASDRLAGSLGAGGWRSVSGLAVLGIGAVACSAPALAAAYWVSSGVSGPVHNVAGPVLPEFVAVSSDTGLRLRTLVLRPVPGGGVTYTVLRDSDPLIGSAEMALPIAAQQALNQCVATLTATAGGAAEDQGKALAGFGIGYVLLPAPVNANLARLLDGVAGLREVSVTSSFDLWRVGDTTAQVTVAQPGGKVIAVPSGPVGVSGAQIPAGGGTLLLAAPAGGWSASLNGQALSPLSAPVNGWAEGFRLPSGGGTLSVSHSDIGRTAIVALEGLAVLVVAGLGLPGARLADAAERATERAEPDGDELLDAAEPAGPRRAGHSQDRSRRRAPRRRKAEPDLAPDTGALGPAATQVTSRLRGAVPAGMRAGLGRRAVAGDAEPPFADESPFSGEPVHPDDLAGAVPRPGGTDDFAERTAVFGGRDGAPGRHGHRASGREEPAARDVGSDTGRFSLPGRRRRTTGDTGAAPGDAAPPGGWGADDPREAAARAGEAAAGRGRRGYSGTRRAASGATGPRETFGGAADGPAVGRRTGSPETFGGAPGGRGSRRATGPHEVYGGADGPGVGRGTGPQETFGGAPGGPGSRRATGPHEAYGADGPGAGWGTGTQDGYGAGQGTGPHDAYSGTPEGQGLRRATGPHEYDGQTEIYGGSPAARGTGPQDPYRAAPDGRGTGPQETFGRGGYPGGQADTGERGGYPPARRGFGRRAGPAPGVGGDAPAGRGEAADPRRSFGRRAAPQAGPGGRGDYQGTRRGAGEPAGYDGGAPGDYARPGPGTRGGGQDAGGQDAGGRGTGGRGGRNAGNQDASGQRGGMALPRRTPGPTGPGQPPGGRRGRFLGQARGAEPGGSLPPARPSRDDGALSPLPPLPPRAPRSGHWEDADPRDQGPGPGSQGEEWDQRGEWDEPEW